MADQPPDPFIVALLKQASPFVPGFAGSILALAFLEKLTARGRVVAVCAGLAAAAFIGPGLSAITDLFWPGAMPAAVDGMIKFVTGLCGMGSIPPFLGWMRKVAGDPLNLLKIQIGPGGVRAGAGGGDAAGAPGPGGSQPNGDPL